MAWAGRTALDLALYLAAVRWVLPQTGPAVRGTVFGTLAAVAALAASARPLGAGLRGAVLATAAVGFVAVAWSRLLTPTERAEVVRRLRTVRERLSPAPVSREGGSDVGPGLETSEPILKRI